MPDNIVLKLKDGSSVPIAFENIESAYSTQFDEPIHLYTTDKNGNDITEFRSPNYLVTIHLKNGKTYMVKGDYIPERQKVVIIAYEVTEALTGERKKLTDIDNVLIQFR